MTVKQLLSGILRASSCRSNEIGISTMRSPGAFLPLIASERQPAQRQRLRAHEVSGLGVQSASGGAQCRPSEGGLGGAARPIFIFAINMTRTTLPCCKQGLDMQLLAHNMDGFNSFLPSFSFLPFPAFHPSLSSSFT